MALTPEDKKDVKTHLGKALANKVSSVTRDGSSKSKALQGKSGGHKQGEREARSKKAGYYVHGHKNYGDVYED